LAVELELEFLSFFKEREKNMQNNRMEVGMSPRGFINTAVMAVFMVLSFWGSMLLVLMWPIALVFGLVVGVASQKRPAIAWPWSGILSAALGIWLGGLLIWLAIGTGVHTSFRINAFWLSLILNSVSPLLFITGAVLSTLIYWWKNRSRANQAPPNNPDQLGRNLSQPKTGNKPPIFKQLKTEA